MATRPVGPALHPVLGLQQSAGNRAVASLLARASTTVDFAPVEITAKRDVSHEQRLRAEIAAALDVPPDDPRVEVALFGDLEVARALKEARRMDAEAKASQTKTEQPEIREDPYKGLTLEQRERRIHEDAVKKELASRGITDEMILKGYRKETRAQLGKARGLLVDQWIPEGTSGRYVHTYEFENEGKTTRVVATTDFAKGGEKTTVRTTIEGGKETTVTTIEPGYGKLGERAALEKTSTRWVVNPDGSVTVETLDKYGRPIPGRSWKPDVLKLR
jgi:hypothetical protein